MLKRLCCEAQIVINLSPLDPILIKSGYATVNGPDMCFVTTKRAGGLPEVYLPGSSLKGVLRAHAERICRTLEENRVCVPYQKTRGGDEPGSIAFCGFRLDEYDRAQRNNGRPESNSIEAYKQSCPACRLFGSTHFIGRMAISDAYSLGTAPRPEPRDGVGINRYTGGAAHGAKFDLEVVTSGTFQATISLRNFEAWQLALVGFLLADLEDSLLRFGSGKSRGLGRMKAHLQSFALTYFGKSQGHFSALADFLTEAEREAYGVVSFAYPEGSAPDLPEPTRRGIRLVHDITRCYRDLLDSLEPAFDDYLRISPVLPLVEAQ